MRGNTRALRLHRPSDCTGPRRCVLPWCAGRSETCVNSPRHGGLSHKAAQPTLARPKPRAVRRALHGAPASAGRRPQGRTAQPVRRALPPLCTQGRAPHHERLKRLRRAAPVDRLAEPSVAAAPRTMGPNQASAVLHAAPKRASSEELRREPAPAPRWHPRTTKTASAIIIMLVF